MSEVNFSFMQEAILEAKKSGADVPVGCVIVKNGKVIARAHNERELLNNVSAHAEILALNRAAEILNNWRLNDCDLYVTLEPCPMCSWAILNSRINKIYFGAYDFSYGALGSKINLIEYSNHKIEVKGGIMEENCENIIKEYFEALRNERNTR